MGMRKLNQDINGFVVTGTFLIGALLVGLVGTAAIVGVYNATQKPDITYNITDTGFSLAGIGLDSTTLAIIIIGVIVVFFMLWGNRKKE